MTRLIHLTDLHFGLHRADLVSPLRDAVRGCQPDLVAVSGDLTQRARAGQFDTAMAFLRGLGTPFLVIPGNHDVPLYNVAARFLAPFGTYRRSAATDLAPTLSRGRLRLFGTNTADPRQWRGGTMRMDEIDRICRDLRDGPPDVTNVLACHHPMEEPSGFQRGETRGARLAMQRLADAGLHIVLSGHLHHWTVGLGIGEGAPRRILQVQAGTALCARTGERDHGFAVLDLDPGQAVVTPWIVDETALAFRPQPARRFARGPDGWHTAA